MRALSLNKSLHRLSTTRSHQIDVSGCIVASPSHPWTSSLGSVSESTLPHRHFSTKTNDKVVDLRSDTVTLPSKAMMEASMNARLGDDVMGDDPTVRELESYMADLFGKERGLYVPTASMANLVAVLSHCHTRAGEIIIGSQSHLCLWEGGNCANLGGVHSMQIQEDENAKMNVDQIRDSIRNDTDDHWPETKLLCLENTHNMMGGIALPPSYMNEMAMLAHEFHLQCHVDGARIFNAAIAQNTTVQVLCQHIDSVSVCFSKGLGAPLGSILLGKTEFIRLAKRARKRCGGGMRQAGVVAAMGLFAVQNNVKRLEEDHVRAQKIAKALQDNGFYIPRNGQIDTNIIYFRLPETSLISKEDFEAKLEQNYGVKLTGGYSTGGALFRIVTHMDVDDQDIDHAIESILTLSKATH